MESHDALGPKCRQYPRSTLRNVRRISATRRFLDHKGSPRINLSGSAKVFDCIERVGRKSVNPYAVLLRVDDSLKCGNKAYLVNLTANNLED